MHTLDLLKNVQLDCFSLETQKFFTLALYQQLAEQGLLHLLFPQECFSFSEQITFYLSKNVSSLHTINSTCNVFGLSKTTLIRKLKKENTSFKQILLHLRMNYALYLMQNGMKNQINIALNCGYQSQAKFSSNFKKLFGISPTIYLKTL